MKKSLKTTLTTALVTSMLLTLAGCGQTKNVGSTGGQNPTDSEKKKIVIGNSCSTQNIDFFVALKQGVEDRSKELGYGVISTNANNDANKQIADIEDLIQKGVTAITVNPQDAEAIIPAIKKANEAGIPVIALDRGATSGKLLAFLETDNVEMGKKAADFIADKLKERYGDFKGNVVELQGLLGSTAARDRGKGFNDEMNSKYPNIKIVARQAADFNQEKALNITTNILQANSNVDAIFGHNDDNTAGALKAIENSGRFAPLGDKKHIIIIGIDGTRQAVKAIRDGKIDATISQIPIEMGAMGVDFVTDYINKKTVPEHTFTKNFIVTKDNVDKEKLWADLLK